PVAGAASATKSARATARARTRPGFMQGMCPLIYWVPGPWKMGRPAHMLPARPPDNRGLTPVAPADATMHQIEELLGADAPTLARLEEMLTEGDAQARTPHTER